MGHSSQPGSCEAIPGAQTDRQTDRRVPCSAPGTQRRWGKRCRVSRLLGDGRVLWATNTHKSRTRVRRLVSRSRRKPRWLHGATRGRPQPCLHFPRAGTETTRGAIAAGSPSPDASLTSSLGDKVSPRPGRLPSPSPGKPGVTLDRTTPRRSRFCARSVRGKDGSWEQSRRSPEWLPKREGEGRAGRSPHRLTGL